METKYRHEVKHVIDRFEAAELRPRLRAVMHSDSHARNGVYFIRSLYFDDGSDSALREKLDGVSRREKFRIRFYNGDLSFIMLEKSASSAGCAPRSRRGCRSRRLAPPPRETLISLRCQPSRSYASCGQRCSVADCAQRRLSTICGSRLYMYRETSV